MTVRNIVEGVETCLVGPVCSVVEQTRIPLELAQSLKLRCRSWSTQADGPVQKHRSLQIIASPLPSRSVLKHFRHFISIFLIMYFLLFPQHKVLCPDMIACSLILFDMEPGSSSQAIQAPDIPFLRWLQLPFSFLEFLTSSSSSLPRWVFRIVRGIMPRCNH